MKSGLDNKNNILKLKFLLSYSKLIMPYKKKWQNDFSLFLLFLRFWNNTFIFIKYKILKLLQKSKKKHKKKFFLNRLMGPLYIKL